MMFRAIRPAMVMITVASSGVHQRSTVRRNNRSQIEKCSAVSRGIELCTSIGLPLYPPVPSIAAPQKFRILSRCASQSEICLAKMGPNVGSHRQAM